MDKSTGYTFLVTTRDVVNPTPDRRARRDWTKAPVIPKGTPMILISETYRLQGQTTTVSVLAKYIWQGERVRENSNPELFQALLDASEPREPTVHEVVDQLGIDSRDVIEHLWATGELTRERLIKIGTAIAGPPTG